MGILCTPVEVMVLRDVRQKRYAKIQPLFDIKYGSWYPDGPLWHSWQDDSINGMFLYSYNLSEGTTSNVSIALPGSEVFHVQTPYDQRFGGSDIVTYTSDTPYIDYQGEQTISNGVTMEIIGVFLSRDKPWVKVGITWDCYATLKQQESVLTGYVLDLDSPTGNRAVWSEFETVATTPYYWFHQIEPDVNDGIGPHSEFNSLYIPAGSQAIIEGPDGQPAVGSKQTRFLGSISVGNVNTYRRGNYHHG